MIGSGEASDEVDELGVVDLTCGKRSSDGPALGRWIGLLGPLMIGVQEDLFTFQILTIL